MSWLGNLQSKLKEQLRIVITNPVNFEVKWTITSSRIQIYSFVLLFSLIIGFLFSLLFTVGPFSSNNSTNDTSIERQKLENQFTEIKKLTAKIEYQEKYIQHVKKVINGEIMVDTFVKDIPNIQQELIPKFDEQLTENELKIAQKVKDDMKTTSSQKKQKQIITYFTSPVIGNIINSFNLKNHPGIDIITAKDISIKACLGGTVIFSGLTQKDGYVIIIEHSNGYTSIYKNAKILLKKAGNKVQTGDPIGIVGNSGEKIFKPHLHFELLFNQTILNPTDYIHFN